MSIDAPGPGIYENVPFATYLSWPYISNSLLRHAKKSLRHFRHARMHGANEETDPMRFGTFVHAGKLEPMAIQERYVVRPAFEDRIRKPDGGRYENPKQSSAYKAEVQEWRATIGSKIEVTAAEFDRMVGVVEALARHPRACEYLDGPGQVEVCFVWNDPETGLLCKGRCDKLSLDRCRISDLKTSFDPWAFDSTIAKFSYHRQGAFYQDGIWSLTGKTCEFCLVAVESTAPFGVRAARLSDEALLAGREEYMDLMGRIAEAQQSGNWDEVTDPDEWQLPSWATPSFQLTMGGETVSL